VTWEQAVDGLTGTYETVASALIEMNRWHTAKQGSGLRTPRAARSSTLGHRK